MIRRAQFDGFLAASGFQQELGGNLVRASSGKYFVICVEV